MRTRIAATAALAAATLLAGCTGTPDTPDAPDTPGETTATAAPGVTLPDTPAGEAGGWVLELIAPDASGPTPEEAEARFSPKFLTQVPATELEPTFDSIRSGGPYEVVEVFPYDPSVLGLRLDAAQPLLMELALNAEGLIDSLLFTADTTADAESLASFAELDSALAVWGEAQVFVADVVDGVCEPVHSTEGTTEGGEPAPSGSVFKLAVLSELVAAIDAGDLAWEDELTITAELKSLPSGELQDRPDGSTATVREAADLMISISDNTATDLLIEAIGRDRMTAAMPGLGVEDADRFDPFLTTRELFLLGWGAPEIREAWAEADDPAERADLLAELPGSLDEVALEGVVTQPVWQDGVDWFLSGAEICGIFAELTVQATTDAGAPILDILAINPGFETPDGVDYLGFKGGSVTGVLADAHILEVDGETRVFVAQIWGDPGTVRQSPLMPYLERGVVLTAEQG